MKFAILLWSAAAAVPVPAQTELVSTTYFPAALEFKDLKAIQSERVLGEDDLQKPAARRDLQYQPVLMEAGLKHYAERAYTLADSGTLSVEVMTLADSGGAYSLLSLLGKAAIRKGPPGDFYSSEGDALLFAESNFLVRIRAGQAGDLARRIAVSVGNRIGRHESAAPTLISYMPRDGIDPATIRYFVGPRALETFAERVAGSPLKVQALVEIAQALYSLQNQKGVLTLLNFPTIPMAEEYFDTGAIFDRTGRKDGSRIYTRRSGSLLGILEGNFEPGVADKTLGSIQFTYAIKWIFDKKNQRPRVIWGVPVPILGTVVRSLLFTALLCLLSIVAGVVIAGTRVFVRRRWPQHGAADTPFIRLKIDEN